MYSLHALLGPPSNLRIHTSWEADCKQHHCDELWTVQESEYQTLSHVILKAEQHLRQIHTDTWGTYTTLNIQENFNNKVMTHHFPMQDAFLNIHSYNS